MIPLSRNICQPRREGSRQFDLNPLQCGLNGDPWTVAVASMLLCRTRRTQMQPCLEEMLWHWPSSEALAHADELELVIRPCGLAHNRARQLQRLSSMWWTESWSDLRDLPGVGLYVADAVGLFCFGCTELECSDHVLHSWAATRMSHCAWCGKTPLLRHHPGWQVEHVPVESRELDLASIQWEADQAEHSAEGVRFIESKYVD